MQTLFKLGKCYSYTVRLMCVDLHRREAAKTKYLKVCIYIPNYEILVCKLHLYGTFQDLNQKVLQNRESQ